MTCQDAGLQLIDETLPRSEALEQHLTACARCRELGSAHRAALALKGLHWELPARSAPVAVRPLWKRRLLLRGSLALLVVALAGASVLAVIPPASPRSPVASASTETAQPVEVAPTPAAHVDTSLEKLFRDVDSYTRAEVTPHDDVLDVFGEVPHALTPSSAVFTNSAAAAWLTEDHR